MGKGGSGFIGPGSIGLPIAAAAEAVLGFWFGTPEPDDAALARRQSGLWWGGSAELDRGIAERFGGLRLQAIAGALDAWLATPRGRLALVVLVDQFSRNILRGTPGAFEHDALARRWCRAALADAADRRLRPIERVFLYLPLEHSEAIDDQRRSVALCEALAREVPAAWRETFEGFADYARRHRDIVERFGRFPHRNALLGRASSAAELAFLAEPGSSF